MNFVRKKEDESASTRPVGFAAGKNLISKVREHPDVPTAHRQVGVHAQARAGIEGGQVDRGAQEPQGLGLRKRCIQCSMRNSANQD